MLFTEPRRSAGRRIRGGRLEELEEGYYTTEPYFQPDQLCRHRCRCLADPRTTRQALNILFKSGTCSMSSWAVASHLVSPPQSHRPALIPANLQLSHSLLFSWKWSYVLEAKHNKIEFPSCVGLSNGPLAFPLFREKGVRVAGTQDEEAEVALLFVIHPWVLQDLS